MRQIIINIFLIFIYFMVRNGSADNESNLKRNLVNRQVSFLDSIFSDTNNERENQIEKFNLNNILAKEEKSNSMIFTMKPKSNEVVGDLIKKYNKQAFLQLNEPNALVNEAKQIALTSSTNKESKNLNNQPQNANSVDSEAIFVHSSIRQEPLEFLKQQVDFTTSSRQIQAQELKAEFAALNCSKCLEIDFNHDCNQNKSFCCECQPSIRSRSMHFMSQEKKLLIVVIISVICITLTILIITLAYFWCKYCGKNSKKKIKNSEEDFQNENKNENNNIFNQYSKSNTVSDEDDTYNDEDIDVIENDDTLQAKTKELSEDLKEIEKSLNKIINEDFKAVSFDINFTDVQKSNFINQIAQKDEVLGDTYDGVYKKLDAMNLELINVVKSLKSLKRQLKIMSKHPKSEDFSLNKQSTSTDSIDEEKLTTIQFEQVYELDKAKSVNEIKRSKETADSTRVATKSEMCSLNIETDVTINKGEFYKIKSIYDNPKNTKYVLRKKSFLNK